ncbi:MAG: FHA domain-containing protein [Kofleriaceae bacterium]|nr:FHA domain-containing protein [Kofleriaceae bacterium]
MYKLIIQDDEGKTTVVPLIREELTIGRQDGNTIRLTERNVSRRHAKLLRGQDSIMIEDLDSYNGVRVNGTRIQGKVEIKEADRVQIGDYLIEVKAEQAATVESEQQTQQMEQVPVPVPVDSSGAETVPTASASGSGDIDVAALAAVAEQPEELFPRMVVLSTAMAGREFSLNKPAMVIGRTEDNDLWINHRSVSQHHAKIVREGDSFTIVDLQSSNGVRVNGEDYGKVELRRGDLIDLGHVRLRFIGADEDFVFGRDAHAIDIGEEGKSKGIWILLVLLLIGIGAFVMFGRGGDDKQSSNSVATDKPVKVEPDEIDTPVVQPDLVQETLDAAVAVVPVADAAVAKVDNVDSDALAAFLASAVEFRTKNEWSEMSAAAKSALELDPSNRKALEHQSLARFEAGNQDNFEKFQLAVGKQQIAKVALYFEQIDEASVYKIKARSDHDRVKQNYKTAQLNYAKKLGKRNDCDGLIQQAAQIPDEWPNIRDAIQAVKCKSSGAANKPNNNKPNNNKPNNTVKPKAETMTSEEAAKTMTEAQAAVRNKQYGKGEKACIRVLKAFPGNQAAAITCAVAACNMKKSQAALRYVRKIKGQRKKNLQQLCTRLGVPGFGEE